MYFSNDLCGTSVSFTELYREERVHVDLNLYHDYERNFFTGMKKNKIHHYIPSKIENETTTTTTTTTTTMTMTMMMMMMMMMMIIIIIIIIDSNILKNTKNNV